MNDYIYLLDLIGVGAFGFFGAYVALRKGLDLFGIFVCSLVSGLGGGTIREVMLANIPFYLIDPKYFFVIILSMLAAIAFYHNFEKVKRYFLIVDALGLATFAFIGADRAAHYNLSSIAIVFFAVITAVGGGILRDVLIREVPYILRKDFYATPAIMLGVLYAVFEIHMGTPIVAFTLIISIFILRVVAIRLGFKLWSVHK